MDGIKRRGDLYYQRRKDQRRSVDFAPAADDSGIELRLQPEAPIEYASVVIVEFEGEPEPIV